MQRTEVTTKKVIEDDSHDKLNTEQTRTTTADSTVPNKRIRAAAASQDGMLSKCIVESFLFNVVFLLQDICHIQ